MSGRVHATVKIACVQDGAIHVVLVYPMCGTQTCTKCISVLVPLRKRTAIPIVVHIVMPSVYHTKFIDATPVNNSGYSLRFAHKDCFCVACIFRVEGDCFPNRINWLPFVVETDYYLCGRNGIFKYCIDKWFLASSPAFRYVNPTGTPK